MEQRRCPLRVRDCWRVGKWNNLGDEFMLSELALTIPLTSSTTNGPTCHPPQAHAVQHHLQPQTCGEDPWWQACLPPLEKAPHCPQVW